MYDNEKMLSNHLITKNSIHNDTLQMFKTDRKTCKNIEGNFNKLGMRQKFIYLLYDLTQQLDELEYQDKIINPNKHYSDIIPLALLQNIINSNTQQTEH